MGIVTCGKGGHLVVISTSNRHLQMGWFFPAADGFVFSTSVLRCAWCYLLFSGVQDVMVYKNDSRSTSKPTREVVALLPCG